MVLVIVVVKARFCVLLCMQGSVFWFCMVLYSVLYSQFSVLALYVLFCVLVLYVRLCVLALNVWYCVLVLNVRYCVLVLYVGLYILGSVFRMHCSAFVFCGPGSDSVFRF